MKYTIFFTTKNGALDELVKRTLALQAAQRLADELYTAASNAKFAKAEQDASKAATKAYEQALESWKELAKQF